MRSAAQDAVYDQARELCKARQQRWLADRGLDRKSPEEQAHKLATSCPETPERVLRELGVDSMPPLRSARVCDRALTASIPYEEWVSLSEAEREPFYIAAPSLPENIGDKQADYLKQMAEMFAAALNGSGNKSRGRG